MYRLYVESLERLFTTKSDQIAFTLLIKYLWCTALLTNVNEPFDKIQRPFASLVISILTPGKVVGDITSYMPIILLSVCYKLLERLIYNRIMSVINSIVPVEQARFRPNRSCCDQVLALTTHIEAGLEMTKKTITVFIDLTAAYDTVWREGLILKFLRIIPCKSLTNLLNNMLSNQSFVVHNNDLKSSKHILNNGLP